MSSSMSSSILHQDFLSSSNAPTSLSNSVNKFDVDQIALLDILENFTDYSLYADIPTPSCPLSNKGVDSSYRVVDSVVTGFDMTLANPRENEFLFSNSTEPDLGTPPSLISSTESLDLTKSFATEDERWMAVLSRDRDADAAFVYCVTSTRIFCRPTCPSRRPIRTNVEFASDSSEASSRGYRPCRRCLPDSIASASESRQVLAVEFAKVILSDCVVHHKTVPTLARLADQVGMSKFYFQRTFKKLTGQSPDNYVRSIKEHGTRSVE